MVFGLCSVFSLGVSATEQQTSFFDTREIPLDLSNPNEVNSYPGKYSWTVSLSPPRFSTGGYVMDSYDVTSFQDIGFTIIDRAWSYRNPFYRVVRFVDAPSPALYRSVDAKFVSSGWDYPATNQVYKLHHTENAMYGVRLGHTDDLKNRPILRAGDRYLISLKADIFTNLGAVSSDWVLSLGDFDILSQGHSNSFTWFWEIRPRNDIYVDQIYVFCNFEKSDSQLHLYSFSAVNLVNFDSVEDAISDQTNEINKNHDETMDKIDDVTDFDEQEQSDLSGAVSGAIDQITEKLGILSFGSHVLNQFIHVFDAAASSPGITLPGFSIDVDGDQHVVWTDQVFDLTSIEDKFGPLITAVHFATSFLVYAALVMYVQKIFSAIMQDWSQK